MNFDFKSSLIETLNKLNEYYGEDPDAAYEAERDMKMEAEYDAYLKKTTEQQRARDLFWGEDYYSHVFGAGDDRLNEVAFHKGYDSVLAELKLDDKALWDNYGKYTDKEASKNAIEAAKELAESANVEVKEALEAAERLWNRQFELNLKSIEETEADIKARREADAAARKAAKKAREDKLAANKKNAKIAGLSKQAQEFLLNDENLKYLDALIKIESQFETIPDGDLIESTLLRAIVKNVYVNAPESDGDISYSWERNAHAIEAEYKAGDDKTFGLTIYLGLDGERIEYGDYHDNNYYEEPYYDEYTSECSATSVLEITFRLNDLNEEAWEYSEDCDFEV